MKPVEVRGIIPPVITPMGPDEGVNLEELRRQVERLLESGVHGIFCFGTNGEGYALDGGEKRQILKAAVSQVRGRVPVYAGTGCVTTRETIAQSRMACEEGADVLSIVTPSFGAASQQELYDHYAAVARAVDLPILLYNIPARTGNTLLPETVARLAQLPNIVGIKDSSGDWNSMLAYLEIGKSRDFAVLSGNDGLILDCLRSGGKGAVAGCANVYPRTLVSLYHRFLAGDGEGAQREQESLASFRQCFQYGGSGTVIKAAVVMLGYDVGRCRAPFHLLPQEGAAALKRVLEENREKGMG